MQHLEGLFYEQKFAFKIKIVIFNKYNNTKNIADQPSLILLRNIYSELEEQISSFSKFYTDTSLIQSIDLDPIHSIDLNAFSHVYSHQEILPRLVEIPSRPSNLKYDTKNILCGLSLQDLISTKDGKLRLLHRIYVDIEIPAIEVCARNIIEFRDMPLQFKLDMGRQCLDEARHAVLIRDRLRQLDGDVGIYPYDCGVWYKYFLGKTLAERLAIQQVVQEGNGLDSTTFLAKELRFAGDQETAYIYDFLHADESNHVRFGNKWLLWCVNNSFEEYEKCLNEAAVKIGKNLPSDYPVDYSARLMAGFPLELI